MKLYYNPISTYSQKVLIALYEKKLAFEPAIVNLMDADARAQYREVYPMGKIPCLILDDGHMIPESSIIFEYIDSLAKPTLIKGDADETRRIRLKDRMFDLYLNDAVVTLLFQGMKPENEQDPERIEKARFHISTMYSFMENEFSQQPFANGEEFLMSDCSAAPGLFYAAISWARSSVFPSISVRRPFESLAIPLINKHFCETMAFRQSVASTD